jgi:hypothetical protein
MNDCFVIFYVKEGKLYPVVMTAEQDDMLQLVVLLALGDKIQCLDKPVGEAIQMGSKQ